jgi:hypothetical protein
VLAKSRLAWVPRMIRTARERWVFVASVLLLTAFAVASAGDLIHTDDGCQVEVHCLACQRVLGSVGVAAVAPPWCPSIEVVGRIATTDSAPAHDPDSPTGGSRAPPIV